MNKLVLFSGLPGVGKTTISKVFCQKNNGQVIDLDDFKKNDVDPQLVKEEIDPPDVRWGYYQKALDHAQSLFHEGAHLVVMDEVFHLAPLREKIERFCMERNIQVVWIEVRCPYSVVVDRLNKHNREGHLLSRDEALLMHRLFSKIFDPFEDKPGSHILVRNADFASVDHAVRFIQAKM
jgi:predicted kinase